ncbi:MAG: hypothetical protein U0325_36545 [Polyangiales bacterium]
MRSEIANYYGVVVGTVCLLAHFAYGYFRCRSVPPFLRLGMSFLSGMGIAPVLQLAPMVVAPPSNDPRVPPTTIRVDDHRTTLVLGLFAILALCVLGLRDNWQDIERQVPPKRASP